MSERVSARGGRARGCARQGSEQVNSVFRNGLAERAGARLEALARYEVRQFVRWLGPTSLQQVDSVVGSLRARVAESVRSATTTELRNFLHYAADQVRRGLVEFGECLVWALPAELSAGPGSSPGRFATGLVSCLMAWSRVHTAVGMIHGVEGEVLRSRWYLGLSTEETSELLELSPEQCRLSLQRALELVRAERHWREQRAGQPQPGPPGRSHATGQNSPTRPVDSGRQ